jgi:leucyl-tRNA synthetase
MLICEGGKMSKSKGNVIPLADIATKYSADLYRLYVTHTADLNSALDWREKNVADVRGKLLRFFEMLSQVRKAEAGKTTPIDRWLLSRINRNIREATAAIEGYRTREYAQRAFFDVLNDLNHYAKRSARRNAGVEYYVAERWLRLMAPVIPHMCEELWEMLGNKPFVSTAAWPQADEKMIDGKAEAGEELVIGLSADIRNVLECLGKSQGLFPGHQGSEASLHVTKIKPKRITVFIAPEWKRSVYGKARLTKNPNALIKEAMQEPEIKKRGKEAVTYVQYLAKHANELLPEILSEEEELKTLSEAAGFLEKEFGAKVAIEAADKSENPKAKNAVPHKPAIFVE